MTRAGFDVAPEREDWLPGRLLTVREVARVLHVHPNTVRQWSDDGLIRSYRIGPRGDRRFSLADVTGAIATAPPNHRSAVLIVDDDREVRQLLKEAVAGQGCRVTAAASGEKALDELEKQQFDLVFLDLVLPGLSGLEVLRSIRANSRSTAVAVVTGYDEDPVALEAMALGPIFFIRKPFKLADVVDVLNTTVLARA